MMACSVEGCGRELAGHGLCSMHLKRQRKHGSPFGGRAFAGEPQRFVCSAAKAETDECIIFPFGRAADGYGRIRVDGRTIGAHHYAAELVHGPRPSPAHESCHSCGRGQDGCVNGRHLYWGTRADNVRDSQNHGTFHAPPHRFGERAPAAKFSDELIADVRAGLAAGRTQMSIAATLGISQAHVSRIKHGARA